jgi:hypothetical protein
VFESLCPDHRFQRNSAGSYDFYVCRRCLADLPKLDFHMTARIYRPSKSAMQSGKGKSNQWVLVHEPAVPKEIDPLMGYTSSLDTRSQVQLTFDTLEEAENYAQKNGIPYSVQPAHAATDKRVNYSDNFRADRKTPWTH